MRASFSETLRAPFPVGALAVLVFVVWAAKNAGFESTTWYAGGIFLAALLALATLAYPPARELPRIAAGAMAFFAAYAVWSLASIAWSSDRGTSWDGANRTALYAVIYALFASMPWRRAHVIALPLAFSVGVVAIGFVDVVRAVEGNAHRYFVGGRLVAPAGYGNAACALYMLAVWPLVYVSARREVHPLFRGVCTALAAGACELALLTESRASLVAVPVAVVAYLALVPQRLRAFLALLPVAAATAFAARALIAPYTPLTHGLQAARELRHALLVIVVTSLGAGAAWFVLALGDRRVTPSRRVALFTGRALLAAALAGAAAALVVFAAASPGRRIDHEWRRFKSGYPSPAASSSHFTSGLGNNRYDFWRVALIEIRRHPVEGVGADNFAQDYVRERHSSEEPLYPHSLELRVVAQTGVVGTALFVGFLVCAAGACAAAFRRHGVAAGVGRAAIAGTAYWLVHGSIDWLWEFPALGGPAIAWLGMAAGARGGRSDSPTNDRRSTFRIGRVGGIAIALAAAAAAVSFAFPLAAALLANRALAEWRQHPEAAFRDLDRSRRLNPLTVQPDLYSGAIASRLDNVGQMHSAFERAIARDPRQWYAHFELALALAAGREWHGASVQLRRAEILNPREPTIGAVRRLIKRHRQVDRDRMDAIFVARLRNRIGR